MELSFILLVVGAILLCAEMFMPGFGVCGISGVIVIIIAAVVAFLSGPMGALVVLSEMALLAVFIFIAVSFLKKRQLQNIILDDTLALAPDDTSELTELVGKHGIVITALRPIGSIEIGGIVYEAYSETGFVKKDQYVKVTRLDKRKIYVKPLDNR